MENNPVAPDTAAQEVPAATSEASQQNTQAAPRANVPAEQVEAFNKFVEANGGFDKAFGKMKSVISNPQPEPEKVAEPAPVKPEAAPVNTQDNPSTPEGFITQEEFAVQQYFNALANEPQYAPIADQIRNGDIIDKMTDFDIDVIRNGNINDSQIRKFASIIAQTVPTTQTPVTPQASAAPTVDYVEVGPNGTITSMDQAMAVIKQNHELKAAGMPGHPYYKQAGEFVGQHYADKK